VLIATKYITRPRTQQGVAIFTSLVLSDSVVALFGTAAKEMDNGHGTH
jgi:hypothetical protein